MDESVENEAQAEFVANIANVQRQLHTYILPLVGNRSDAEDILQEVNFVMWRRSNTFETGTNFRAWAYQIAKFQIMAYRKKKYKLAEREWLDSELVETLAEESMEDMDYYESRNQALHACLQKLPQDKRKLVARRYSPGGCVNDIATEMDKAPKAVSEMLRRIRQTLQKCITQNMAPA